MEVEYNKLSLKPGDYLVIKLNTNGLTEEEARQKLSEIRNDEFIKYIEDKGNKVFVSYTGVDFSILRMLEGDKLVAYIDVTDLSEEEASKYEEFVSFKLEGNVPKEQLIIVPRRKNSPELAVKTTEEEKE